MCLSSLGVTDHRRGNGNSRNLYSSGQSVTRHVASAAIAGRASMGQSKRRDGRAVVRSVYTVRTCTNSK